MVPTPRATVNGVIAHTACQRLRGREVEPSVQASQAREPTPRHGMEGGRRMVQP